MIYGHEAIQEMDLEFLMENSNKLSFKDFIDMLKRWKTSNQNHSGKEFKANNLTDKEYEEMKETFATLHKKTVEYPEYKKAFEKLCKFINVAPTGTIIYKHKLTKKIDGKHEIYVKTYDNNRTIQLPDSVELYHKSKVSGIRKLKAVFKGKSVKGYLYYKPRVYFTIYEKMPKVLADYKPTDKVHVYKCKENIKNVYVDPLVWSGVQGAIYVERDDSVPVEQLN